MRRTLILFVILCIALATPVMAARLVSTSIVHLNQVFQACNATSVECLRFAGYQTPEANVINSAPGVLSIDPGGPTWPNFIGAAIEGVPYTVKNVSLVKQPSQYVQCNGVFPTATITQQGTPNIRLWWPLMYELPSTTYTLSILYGTPVLYDDDGLGPNPPAWVHQEQWIWHVDTDLPHLYLLLNLFHELPFGLDEVPLISDEPLFAALLAKIEAAAVALECRNFPEAASILADFELEVMDACIGVSPAFPNPTGIGTGIANTTENPACCKLLVDVEYILLTAGVGQPGI